MNSTGASTYNCGNAALAIAHQIPAVTLSRYCRSDRVGVAAREFASMAAGTLAGLRTARSIAVYFDFGDAGLITCIEE
ncbi:hypothetical protein [Streptomyces asiaticus]